VFCGKGNNGGDGLAIARQLLQLQYTVQIYVFENDKPASPDFETNLKRLNEINKGVYWLNPATPLPVLEEKDIVVEAIFGTGLNKPATGFYAAVINHLNTLGATIASIDMPGGMYTDQSSMGNTVVQATHTLTFQCHKLALLMAENNKYTGEVQVLDIGLHKGYSPSTPASLQTIDSNLIQAIYKPRNRFSHKGTFGHALIVGGKKGTMGACILSARACLRSGCGLVTASVPSWGMAVMQTAFSEAMALPFNQLKKSDLHKYNAVGIGPGLGTGAKAKALVHDILVAAERPVVVDADGLNILAANKGWMEHLPPGSILTPHPKEFERLFGPAANDFEKMEVARRQAIALGVVIVLKGHHTFIAAPNGEGFFNTTGNSGMATGGSGDVLTGMITGLLCQGYSPSHAALLGVYLHGTAGDLAAVATGQEALIATDLINHIGAGFKTIAHN
jgi:NAD(P)H-hydrate epimerase